MLVRLYDVHEDPAADLKFREEGIKFFRVLSPNIGKAVEFARSFSEGWANECLAACTNHPATCMIAVKNRQIIGFACFNATAKDYFGPTGVMKEEQGKGIGMALLKKCLLAMAAEGYAYAIIGGVGDAQTFYEKSVGATVIERSSPGLYGTMVELS